MKIGLFVGSFNPITTAHEKIADDLLEDKIIDSLYFLPVNSKKIGLISISKRIHMIRLILKEHQNVLSIYNYSIDGFFNYIILNKIYKQHKITHLIMGSDLFLKFKTFSNYQDILKKYILIIINREDNIKKYIEENYQEYKNNIIIINKEYKGSSFLAKKELSLNQNNYLNSKVFDYINKNQLYK